MDRDNRYTCGDYRQEMILISLKRQLQNNALSDREYEALIEKIQQLESEMGLL